MTGDELAIASGPWAPVAIEQRANAFAAAFLMPTWLLRNELSDAHASADDPETIRVVSGQTSGPSQAALSSYVPAHGVRRTGTVVTYMIGAGNSSTVVTRLAAPVDGHQVTTASVPYELNAAKGSPITVLVDPKNPGYAELPGKPVGQGSDSAYELAGGIVFTLVGLGVALLVIWLNWVPLRAFFRAPLAYLRWRRRQPKRRRDRKLPFFTTDH